MRVRVLGCSGGIGGHLRRTTAMLVDNDLLIDAGTGVADLSLAELALIDHVFLTHSHLDHIASLPLLIDSVSDLRDKPLTVYATAATLDIIGRHIFNWAIWPDFSVIPSREKAIMRFQSICLGQSVRLGERTITALPAEHTVPAVGYQLDSGLGSLVFTGDTTANDAFWPVVNRIANLRYLLIETAFPNRDQMLAEISKHLCPKMLANELKKLSIPAEIYISHLKPSQIELTMAEIQACAGDFKPRMLQNNQVFEF
ncbi:MAG: 3',5'-cyclic-nucleotide phosphodiesterase [Candidatus Accumulibacter phosphatis]|jgi:ribonuclease BN (tRNA processing enzyme)|uniref:3',5'-cyclic-nucleotide phosphodiesterase n=2 Tax=Candidatus Accumulibacter contiguus TaxID=2954381 RepID=A0ABX1T7M9_9PROT|nr:MULTISPECIES: 3',5'-cyclic-nucleotide phosphodiesterase [Candidatus Accumulibacter]MBL8408745.1 3',5'-cyclic-nucleotide phosphodiesterase [Accumulibacter sp.]NMQ05633.1 3',5'-cyclic-nucleotide phosphodiesterase [Candidatus Accumulibacter contiguus]HRF12804.1 3',5'-cyclic-nucleotide phosphodiesterase [Candidatus Accumulibacter phosphatis]